MMFDRLGEFNNYAGQMMGPNGFINGNVPSDLPVWMAKFAVLVPILIVLFVVWSLFWKGWALWKAARKGEKVWFFVLLVVNTLGILEILYIFWFSKREGSAPIAGEK